VRRRLNELISAPTVAADGDASETSIIVESRRRLSQSVLWRCQRRFFEEQGVEAFSAGTVPHYITGNPCIAQAYTRLVLGWLRDFSTADAHRDQEPIHIVELGAGSGRFAFHFLRRLVPALESPSLRGIRIRYLLTDLSRSALDFARSHPLLAPYVDSGVLTFAPFDAEGDQTLVLPPHAPMIVLANYFFDGIAHDAFAVRDGVLHEGLATLTSPRPEPDPTDPELLTRGALTFEYAPLAWPRDGYYGDDLLDDLLRGYEDRLADTAFLLPVGALRLLDRLRTQAGGRLLLLSADKGIMREADLLDREAVTPAIHGSVSFPVNYHAIAQYAAAHDGEALLPAAQFAHLGIGVFLVGQRAGLELRLAHDDAVARWSPDDFYSVKKGLEPSYGSLSLDQLLAFLRLSGWDVNVFLGSHAALLGVAAQATRPQREDLYAAVQAVWDAYYPIGEERDLAFEIGLLLCEIAYYREALPFFERSLESHGDDAGTLYNCGLCHHQLGDHQAALSYMDRALALDPKAAGARALRIEVEAHLRRRGKPKP
jgi:hypothetical protein